MLSKYLYFDQFFPLGLASAKLILDYKIRVSLAISHSLWSRVISSRLYPQFYKLIVKYCLIIILSLKGPQFEKSKCPMPHTELSKQIWPHILLLPVFIQCMEFKNFKCDIYLFIYFTIYTFRKITMFTFSIIEQ